MDPRRAIPSVDRLLTSAPFAGIAATTHRGLLLEIAAETLQDARDQLARGDTPIVDIESWAAAQVGARLDALRRSSLQRVINATGVVLHTNLGRAPLAGAAIHAITQAGAGYSTLEYDVRSGARGSRYDHCAPLLRRLTGAEDALVVNNTAAALVLALNTMARGKQVIVSRGELVEIGGSFRVPDIMARSGARLVEVGATNRTHPQDYMDAVTTQTALLLKVHRSNFSMQGFTAEADIADLATIAHSADVPLMYDLGSGLLNDAHAHLVPGEPDAAAALADGADIVALSGDKLLGGPQCGILLSRSSLIARMKRNPLLRALRVDKFTIAALEATLLLHLDPAAARREIPVLRMLSAQRGELRRRAVALHEQLHDVTAEVDVVDGLSAVGGGAAPSHEPATVLLTIRCTRPSAATVARRLRSLATPVIVRIEDDSILLDLRTVDPADEALLVHSVRSALSAASGAAGADTP